MVRWYFYLMQDLTDLLYLVVVLAFKMDLIIPKQVINLSNTVIF